MKFIRLSVFSILVAWLVISLWGWFIGGGSSCGAMFRIIGFTTWLWALHITSVIDSTDGMQQNHAALGLGLPITLLQTHSATVALRAVSLPCS